MHLPEKARFRILQGQYLMGASWFLTTRRPRNHWRMIWRRFPWLPSRPYAESFCLKMNERGLIDYICPGSQLLVEDTELIGGTDILSREKLALRERDVYQLRLRY